MNAQVRVDVCGQFTINPSTPKEKLDHCPIEPWKHNHETIDRLQECYLGKKRTFEESRRVEWQLLLNSVKLKEAQEPCPKCGCFLEMTQPRKMQGSGNQRQ